MIQFHEEKSNLRLNELRRKEEEELAEILSKKYEVPYADLSRTPINTDALRLIPEVDARANSIAAFEILGKKLSVAVLSPNNQGSKDQIKTLGDKGYIVSEIMVSHLSLEKAWERYKEISFAMETKAGALDISSEEIQKLTENVKSVEDIKKLIQEALSMKRAYRVSRVLVIIMAGALSTKASDVHIEPEEEYTGIRYRLDGVLIPIIQFDNETYNLLLSRIKLLSGLKLNVKEAAQDGRFSIQIFTNDIEIRTSLIPGAYGESIVMRLLNPKSLTVPLEELGIEPRLFKILEREIERPDGMILTTGPTGSGKTTTLYSFLRRIQNPEYKIITIEDPVEYHLPGIVQTQVDDKKGYTFSAGLRSVLRQDPDIIMVGEIRDGETAATAIDAALTGHLVFSTLHTNNAAGAFPRLIDLGMNPKVLTSAIHVALAQRLVRKLCPVCIKEIPIPEERMPLVNEVLSTIRPEEFKEIPTKVFVSPGCLSCNNTGFKGRIGVYEAILSDSTIESVVEQNPSEREIKAAAKPQGIYNMKQDGVIKVLRGVTSFDELERVVDLGLEPDLVQHTEDGGVN